MEIINNDAKHVYSALKQGVKDFFAVNGFKQAVLGLSGGIDSAVVAAIAVDALGAKNVLGVTMPSQFSSNGSVVDSIKLAQNLGIVCETIPIKDSFDTLCTALSGVFTGTEFGLAEENMQARIRGVILMAISNKFNRILLATGNKSELAVGYCTLYGDMNGALAILGDVYKCGVYDLANYINRNSEIIPADTVTKAPSAELRPNQKDQDSLPPYGTLDKILKMLIDDVRVCDEIIKSGESKETVEWIARAIKNNRFKRKQAAEFLKLSKNGSGYSTAVEKFNW